MTFTTEKGVSVELTESDIDKIKIQQMVFSSTLTEIKDCLSSAKKDLETVRHHIYNHGCLDNGCSESEETYEAGYVSGVEYVLQKLHLLN